MSAQPHAVSNAIPIPITEIERMLIARAVPDFTGAVTVHIRVLPTAGHEVEFRAEVVRHCELNRSEEKATPIVTNERVGKVRRALAEHADKFRLVTGVIGVKASFVAGELRSFQILEGE